MLVASLACAGCSSEASSSWAPNPSTDASSEAAQGADSGLDAKADAPPSADAGADSDAAWKDAADGQTESCAPLTCQQVGAACGTIDDGCGGTAACGDCPAPATCGAGGKANQCGTAASLAEYWVGQARWKFERSWTLASTGWSYGYGAGTHMEVLNGAWYLFSRRVDWGNKPASCPFERLSTEVRRSDDHGVTWSPPSELFAAQPGSAWECAATDGDGIYDAASGTWHYLFQCLGASGGWKGCHATRASADPMGPFVIDPVPVIEPGALWNSICDLPGDHCSQLAGGPHKVFDEGTFDIFHHDGASFFVSFHGFDGVRGYRGIAKTPDFKTWIAGDPSQGVPSDAIEDANDAAGWRESWHAGGNIGAGSGCILNESGLWYLLFEAADINLGCTAGQNWDFGIARALSLTDTVWDQLPAGNPIYYSSKAPESNGTSLPCNVQYAKLFRDAGETWMHVTRESVDPAYSGVYLYRLVADRNLLRNGDLWMCETGPWKVFPAGPTNLVVYRFPNGSTDGNCYLATNCGQSPCAAGQSVYQDVPASSPLPATMKWGGSFLAEGGSANVEIVIHELDASMGVLATHSQTAAAGASWQSVSSTFSPSAGVATFRFQIYLSSPLTFRADEMFLEPTP